jgi:hypothetical protein
VTPHLTIAQGASAEVVAEIVAQAGPALPIAFAANEVWLMEQRERGQWRTKATFPVGTRRT